MGSNPINLAFRFILELMALGSAGYWAWNLSGDWKRYALVILVPLSLAVIWGVFNVPGDPSRSGNAPVPVPGILRLLIELGIFAFAAWGLFNAGNPRISYVLCALVILHYLLSYDRIGWLLKQ